MLPVTDRFLNTLRVPHVVAVRATIEQPGADPVQIPIIGGAVTIDETAAVTTTGSLTVPWTLAEETEATLGLDLRTLPYGSYAYLERGVRYGDGSREYVPLGRLRINAVSWRSSENVASLELADRMAQLADKQLGAWTPAGLTATEAISYLVDQTFPDIGQTIETTPATETDLVGVTYEGTSADAIADLAGTIAAIARFDREGDFVLSPRPAAPGEPVWSIDASAEGVFIDADESLDRTETFSVVIVRGQTAAKVPFQHIERDTDPLSPTYHLGPFGSVELVHDSTAIMTSVQANLLAEQLLAEHQGLARSLTVESVLNPALELGDTVRLLFPDGREEDHLVAVLGVPLDATTAASMATRSTFMPGAAALASRNARTHTALATLAAGAA